MSACQFRHEAGSSHKSRMRLSDHHLEEEFFASKVEGNEVALAVALVTVEEAVEHRLSRGEGRGASRRATRRANGG